MEVGGGHEGEVGGHLDWVAKACWTLLAAELSLSHPRAWEEVVLQSDPGLGLMSWRGSH